jgi:cephalosporin hydroxylase
MGIPAQKCPLDLWVYQEILWEIRPDLIIECGTAQGGSALFLASICDLLNKGKIISIDIEDRKDRPLHRRIEYWLGSSIQEEIMARVKSETENKGKVMIILDSDHHKEHVLKELHIYSPFVSQGSYLIVEDTNINGHPVLSEFGPGPMEAVTEFLKGNADFVIDEGKEKFFMTFNPRGFLLRVR